MREHSTPHLRTRLLVAFAAALLSLTVTVGASPVVSMADAKKAGKRKKAKKSKRVRPLTGIYDACSVNEPKRTPLPDCGDRLVALRQGGFQVVLNYWSNEMTVEENLEYANMAHSVGMQVIWNLSSYRQQLAPKLDLVNATKDHPATWGYYIGDEVVPALRDQVVQLSGAVRSLTNRPTLYISRPSPSKLRPFKGLADYIGPDVYPVGPFDRPVKRAARMASKIVKKGNLAMVLQAYSWSIDFPDLSPQWPSAAQMRKMRNQATRKAHPKLLLWFCFHCITDYHPDPDSYFPQLTWAANGSSLGPNYRMSSASL